MTERETLFNTGDLAAHLHRAPECNGMLVYTFTERGPIQIDGPGFGVSFLLKHGFDVVSVKSGKWLWYENLQPDAIDALRRVSSNQVYRVTATYGSSMGGYAAFRFAKDLCVHNALALSPLMTIKADWDRRWQDDAEKMDPARDMFPVSAVDHGVKYLALYDNMNPDRLHVRQFEKLLGSCFRSLRVPFAGHPLGPTLRQYGQLESIAVNALAHGVLPPYVRRPLACRWKSDRYLFIIAREFFRRKNDAAAKATIEAAIRLNYDNPEYHVHLAKIYRRAGLFDEAIAAASRSAVLKPANPHFALFRDMVVGEQLRKDRQNIARSA